MGRTLHRAEIARWALGANPVQEVVYGYARQDSKGEKLSGKYNYKLELDPLPPVSEKGFWSVTIYAADGTLVDNPDAVKTGVSYSAIGMPFVQAHKGAMNKNGGMTLYFQANAPDDQDSVAFQNWIPTPPPPAGFRNSPASQDFIVLLRMYLPCESVTGGGWKPCETCG